MYQFGTAQMILFKRVQYIVHTISCSYSLRWCSKVYPINDVVVDGINQ